MATKKPTASKSKTSKPKRRIVKKAETVRELTQASTQPKPQKNSLLRLVGHYIAVPFKPIFRPIGRVLAKVGRLKPFRILGKILLPTYVRNSWKELRQVTWLTGRESFQLTLAVIIFSIVFGVIIALVDFGLDKGFKQILLK